MYDTIEIVSPEMPDITIKEIKFKSIIVQKIDAKTGELMYQLTTHELEGSFDSRLSVKIVMGNRIKVSGSVHKFILGHNCFGGPKDIKMCCRYLVALVNKKLDMALPNWSTWEMTRVDITHVFDLGSINECQEYLKMMRGCRYPRRQTLNYGINSYYFPGSSTTIKFYIKGTEFKVHDKKRLKRFCNDIYNSKSIEVLQKLADRLLRVEVEVRRRKLKYDGMSFRCGDLIDDYFNNVYVGEVSKIMKEGQNDMEIVRDIISVKDRLNEAYSKRKANNLFSVWSRIQVEGEESLRNSVSKAQYYRYKKDFAKVGVSLQGNVKILCDKPSKHESRIINFIPLPGERYHVDGVFCDVEQAIRQLELTA